MKKTRILSLLTAAALLVTTAVPAFASEAKWSQTTTKDGWIKIEQDGGPTLGYSPDSGVTILEDGGYAFKDLNKNGTLDPYEDWRLDVSARAENLASQMDKDQIAGLMLLAMDISAATGVLSDSAKVMLDQGIRTYATMPFASTSDAVGYINQVQAYAEKTALGIPVESQAEPGTAITSWPSNLAVAATFDPAVAAQMANLNAIEYRAIGITSINGPQIDLATEPRWSRIQSTFGEDPQLASDMAAAYVNALQSTYAEDGTDLGWGAESVNAFIKHYPGDGAAEGGRESHNAYGAFNVLPGDQLYTQLMPFAASLEVEGLTGQSSGVMPSYSITVDDSGESLGDEAVGSGYSYYKVTELLREEMGFNGVTVTDYQIPDSRPYGVENLTLAERYMMIIEAGNDKVGASSDIESMKAGIALYMEKYGEDAGMERLRLTAARIATNMLRLGLFENAYKEASVSNKIVGSKTMESASFDAQVKSLVMLKNANGLIQERADKPTIYIPMEYTAATPATDGTSATAASPASANLPMDARILSKYFNIVTDTLASPYTGPADEDGNPTMCEADIIPPSAEELAKVDFALCMISSPSTGAGYDSATETYLPISLQYRPYTANSIFVRQTSLAGNELTVEVQDTYGAQVIKTLENRSYYGKTVTASNESDLDKVLNLAAMVDKVVVVISADRPMVFSEFESEVEAIIMDFGITDDEALMQILSGKVEPSGLLPLQMPASMDAVEMQYEDVPRDMECHVDAEGNVYDFAFGLDWEGVIEDERTEKYNVPALEG